MSNVYVDAGKYEQVLDVRDMMKQRNAKKNQVTAGLRSRMNIHM